MLGLAVDQFIRSVQTFIREPSWLNLGMAVLGLANTITSVFSAVKLVQAVNAVAQSSNLLKVYDNAQAHFAKMPKNIDAINGTSYDIRMLYKTQPSSYTNRGVVNNMIESIKKGGTSSVPRIPVRVHNGKALVVDGHHRLQAFLELGYNRIPIKYIHENQITNYGRTLQDLLSAMYK